MPPFFNICFNINNEPFKEAQLKIIVEQIYGSQQKVDLHLQRLKLQLNESSEKEAIENGWLIFDGGWYSSRSTRINCDFYSNEKIKNDKSYTYDFIENGEATSEIEKVYDNFLAYKKFPKLYKLEIDQERTSWLICRKNNVMCAFTKFNMYDGGIESSLTAWDYSEPKASIGKKILFHEIDVAKTLNYKYLYIGSGYGFSGKYKADFRGFEWWDGENWSTDKNTYKELCERDEKVGTLKELSEIYAN